MHGRIFSQTLKTLRFDALQTTGIKFAIIVDVLAFVGMQRTFTAEAGTGLQPVTNEMLLSAQGGAANWLMYGRNYQSWRYSQLTQVNTENVKKLVTKWAFQIGTPYDKFECTPLVVNGVMFITTPYSTIYAIDARTGKEIWRYNYPSSTI